MKRFYLNTALILFSLALLFAAQAMAQAPEISPQLIQTDKERISRTVYDLTFKATLINHDTAIKKVSAKVVSASPYIKTPHYIDLDFPDMAVNATASSKNTFVLRVDRSQAFDPKSLVWNISYDPVLQTGVEVDGVVEVIDNPDGSWLRLGGTTQFNSGFGFSTKDQSKTPFTLSIKQTISPSVGLTISPGINGSVLHDEDGSGHIHANYTQYLSASQPGLYIVTTSATVLETGKTVSKLSRVKVYAPNELQWGVTLYVPEKKVPVGASASAIKISATAYAIASEQSSNLVTGVVLKHLESGTLHAMSVQRNQMDGRNWWVADTSTINTAQAGQCHTIVAVAKTSQGDVESEPEKICVTEFPILYKQPDPNHFRTSRGGIAAANNFLLIKVANNTPEARVKIIAKAMNGQIVGQDIYDPIYQIEVLDAPPADRPESFSELLDKADAIVKQQGFTEVKSVDLYTQSGRTMSLSDDPFFLVGKQNYLEHIRATEAWYVGGTKEAPVIAVVDTGVDFDHPDIRSKLFVGKTFFPPETDTTDDHNSHGTHVAGIAAAITNNGLGIAGVSRNSNILPVRVSPTESVFYEDMAKGIAWAAEQEAQVINVSIGVPENLTPEEIQQCVEKFGYRGEGVCDEQKASTALCDAVKYASGKSAFVVVAAGNAGINRRNYPGLCDGAIAVGGTTDDGLERWKWAGGIMGSNFGDWISIAAPAENIVSLTNLDFFLGSRLLSYLVCDPAYASVVGDYGCKSGTSQAAPQVSGALAQVLARHPEWHTLPDGKPNPDESKMVKNRLLKTAKKLPPEIELGKGLLNVFDAVFNGDFELPDEANTTRLAEWQHQESADVHLHCKGIEAFGEIRPRKGQAMLACGTQGVNETSYYPSVGSYVRNIIDIPEGVTELPLSFRWKVASVDLSPDRQAVPWNDQVIVKLQRMDDPDKEDVLFNTSLNNIMATRNLAPVTQMPPFWQTNWTTDSFSHPLVWGSGKYYLTITALDLYDALGDTYFFVDDLQFRLR